MVQKCRHQTPSGIEILTQTPVGRDELTGKKSGMPGVRKRRQSRQLTRFIELKPRGANDPRRPLGPIQETENYGACLRPVDRFAGAMLKKLTKRRVAALSNRPILQLYAAAKLTAKSLGRMTHGETGLPDAVSCRRQSDHAKPCRPQAPKPKGLQPNMGQIRSRFVKARPRTSDPVNPWARTQHRS